MIYFVDRIEELEGGKKGLIRNEVGGYIDILENVELVKV